MNARLKSFTNITLHDLFEIGLVIKAIDGFLQLVGGLVLLVISHNTIHGLIGSLTTGELNHDPHNFIANALVSLDHRLNHGLQLFAALYLIGYGAVKLVLAVSLLRKRAWVYRPALIILTTFLVYQIYQIGYTHSKLLIGLTIADAIVLALITREYHHHTNSPLKT